MTLLASRYDDAYPTCQYTHVTLRVYSDTHSPEVISEMLELAPSDAQHKDKLRLGDDGRAVKIELHGWFLSSEGKVRSRDVRPHLDWLLSELGPRVNALRALCERGAHADIACLWVSATGVGGPTLSAKQCAQLADIGVDFWFDIITPN